MTGGPDPDFQTWETTKLNDPPGGFLLFGRTYNSEFAEFLGNKCETCPPTKLYFQNLADNYVVNIEINSTE
jgi:hypothetical protein